MSNPWKDAQNIEDAYDQHPDTEREAMTETELREIEARAEAATPGPWEVRNRNDPREGSISTLVENPVSKEDFPLVLSVPSPPFALGSCGALFCYENAEANAEFVIHARTDIPRLIKALREAREEIEEHKELLAEYWERLR